MQDNIIIFSRSLLQNASSMSPFFKTVSITALVAGTLDIVSAYVYQFIRNGEIPKKMFHYISGAALGLERSMKGGFDVVLMGIFFHYFIAFAFTIFFFIIYKRLKLGDFNTYVVGLLYGLFAWIVMNRIVLPLSKLPHFPFNWQNAVINALILMFMIGLPISISAHKYFKKNT